MPLEPVEARLASGALAQEAAVGILGGGLYVPTGEAISDEL